jgi:hypothetical protein
VILGPKRLRNIAENLEKGKRKEERCYPNQEECLGSLLGVCMQLAPSNMSLSCKNSKQKLAGNAAKTPNLVTEISVYTQKFPAKYIRNKSLIF